MLRIVVLAVTALSVLPTASVRAQAPSGVEAEVANGVRQVQDGDFEGAVATLEAAIARLKGDAQRQRLWVQAEIQLAVAEVALDHTERAVQALAEALAVDPHLRLSPDAYSPKVLRALETARTQAGHGPRASAGKSSGKTVLLVGVGAAVAGTAIALAAKGSGQTVPIFSGARFGTPALDCPNDSVNLALPFTILVEANNRGGDPVTINSATSLVTIVSSPGNPSEVGFALSGPTTVTPSTIPGKQNATLQVVSTLLCGNGPGDAARFNDWSGRVTLTTSAGLFVLDVADRMRVNIP